MKDILRSNAYYPLVAFDAARPNGLQKRIRRLGLLEPDTKLAEQLLRDTKNRLSASVALRMPGSSLLPNEQAGVIYFVSLVNAIDDHIDGIDKQRIKGGSLRDQIDSLPVETTTVGELMSKTLDLLPEPKAEKVAIFFDKMFSIHQPGELYPAGSYSFADANYYRSSTTMPFVHTVTDLIDLDPRRLTDIDHCAWTVQLADDAKDVGEDMSEQTMNLFVGMASDNGELGVLQRAMEDPGVKPRVLFKKPVQTHTLYMREIDAEIGQLSTAPRKGAMKAISKLYMRL